MQFLLDGYLSEVERYLRTLPPNIRTGEIDEMASHLQQLRADFVAQGHTSEEAEALAIGRFGPARKAGLRLRDVWEGNRGVWATLFAVLLSNAVLFIANLVAGAVGFTIAAIHNYDLAQALEPVFVGWLCWMVFGLPFGLNFALGRWAGRRAVLPTLLIYLPLWTAKAHGFEDASAFDLPNVLRHLPHLMVLATVSATVGAWSGSASKRRQCFALVGGAPLETASILIRRRLPARRVLLRLCAWLAALGLCGAAAASAVKARLYAIEHPPTPEAAVRVMLSNPGWNGNMKPATNVSIRLLPATPGELKRGERRVSYTATMHATESHRKRRIAFLRKNLEGALAGRYTNYDALSCRQSLARLKPEGYTISRVVRVQKTAQGWQIVSSVNGNEEPWAWLEDVYYERH